MVHIHILFKKFAKKKRLPAVDFLRDLLQGLKGFHEIDLFISRNTKFRDIRNCKRTAKWVNLRTSIFQKIAK